MGSGADGMKVDMAVSETQARAAPTPPMPSPYHRHINGAMIDVYDILHAYRDSIGNPALEHAIKKLLVPGGRGHKDRRKDIEEARWSIDRAIRLESRHDA